ncbi:MAG: hypothetical protein KC656_16055 [Myxococcales bacterium]|nr:hypothetical protein [Myxococcales bacterium]MCB9670235.1 hypothetical protein [Alphaproteobacteria bacterium]
MEADELYELVSDAVRQALADEAGGGDVRLTRRMTEGRVLFEDSEGKVFKEIPGFQFFRKTTAVREKLRVLEQKINNHGGLTSAEKAELQALISRAYGSLTTFNFLFRDDQDRFSGTGG